MRIVVAGTSRRSVSELWALVADLAAWPAWCPAFIVVQPDGALAEGTRVRIAQPGMRVAVWTVDEVAAEGRLRMSSRGPGFVVVSERNLEPAGTGSAVRLSLTVTGPMAWAVSLISRRPMHRYLRMEARSLGAVETPAG